MVGYRYMWILIESNMFSLICEITIYHHDCLLTYALRYFHLSREEKKHTAAKKAIQCQERTFHIKGRKQTSILVNNGFKARPNEIRFFLYNYLGRFKERIDYMLLI